MNEATTFDPKFLFNDRLNAAKFMEHGGPHLGAVRSRMQIMFINSESVTCGSHDELSPPATVRDIEELAAFVAEGVLRNVHEYMPKNNVFNQNAILRDAITEALRALEIHRGQMISPPADEVIKLLNDALEKYNCQCGNLPHHFGCSFKGGD